MIIASKNKKEIIIATVVTLPFFYLLLSRYINLDFWFDEVYGFKYFVFQGMNTIFTDYHVPTNHIFFNIINRIYFLLIGMPDMYSLMDAPYKIRILMLVYCLLTLICVYFTCRKFFNKYIATISLAVLVTTVPYYNFTLQIRGYGLSIMIICTLIYFVWMFEEKGGYLNALLIVILGSLLLYTIPLNLYVLSSIIVFYFITGTVKVISLGRKRKNVLAAVKFAVDRKQIRQHANHYVIAFLLMVSIGIAGLFYFPVLTNLFFNKYVKSIGMFNFETLCHIMPQTLVWFLSERYILLLIAAVGIIASVFLYRRKQAPAFMEKYIFCAVCLFLPFLLSFIRGDNPYFRVFVNLTPFFALFVSCSLYFILKYFMPGKQSAAVVAALLVIIYCNVKFAFAVVHKDDHIIACIETDKKLQNIYYNYYQAGFNPHKIVKKFYHTYYKGKDSAVLVSMHDEAAITSYLSKYQIEYSITQDCSHLRSIMQTKKPYVITSLPVRFIKLAQFSCPKYSYKAICQPLQYHNIIEVEEKENGIL